MKKNIIIIFAVFAVSKNVLGYPHELLMPDGTPVHTDESNNEDSVAAASETHEHDYDDSDDSDMYMEPDGAESVHQKPKEINPPTVIDEHVTVTVPIEENKSIPIAQEDKINPVTDSQNFFPSFADIFTNHRLPYNEQQQQQQQQQQQRYRPNRFLGYLQRDRSSYQPIGSSSTVKNTQHPLLGSGNFGVIRGGTYYPDEKENDDYSVVETLYNPYYSSNNARGRSNYYKNPKPQPIRGGDFFANFRDFADITAPPKSSFSHLSVVYANRNGTQRHANEPRNIIETLKMLEDQDNDNINGIKIIKTTTTDIPMKKISQSKRKLQNMKKYHEEKSRKYRMTIEPLLALS